MSSWIGWLSRPSKTVELEVSSPLEKNVASASATASSSATNSPSKTRLYPSLTSTVSGTSSAPLLSDVIRDDWVNEASKNETPNSAQRHLSEKELSRIKEENDRLKAVLQQIHVNEPSTSSSKPSNSSLSSSYNFQHVGHIPGGNGFLLSIPSISSPPTASNPFATSASSPSAASTASSSSSSLQEKSEALVCHGDHSTVLVKQKEEENDKENAVALLDLNEMDWWVMVNGTEGKDKSSTPSSSSSLTTTVEMDDDDCVHREGGLRIVKSQLAFDDEGYVLIDENDFIQALSDFISQSIARQYPEAEKIPPQELQKILRQAFTPIKQPSNIGKAYQWAQFLYQSYSWGSCAWSLYREPFYVKLVLRGAMKAAQWLLVLVI